MSKEIDGRATDIAGRIRLMVERYGNYGRLAEVVGTALGMSTYIEMRRLERRMWGITKRGCYPKADIIIGLILGTGCNSEWLLLGRGDSGLEHSETTDS